MRIFGRCLRTAHGCLSLFARSVDVPWSPVVRLGNKPFGQHRLREKKISLGDWRTIDRRSGGTICSKAECKSYLCLEPAIKLTVDFCQVTSLSRRATATGLFISQPAEDNYNHVHYQLIKTLVLLILQVRSTVMKVINFSSVYCLTLVLILWPHDVESSAGVTQWCVDDVTSYDSYQSTLAYVNSSSIGQSELQTLIDDAFTRAGCHWLETTSSTNLSCSNVSEVKCVLMHKIYKWN